MPTPYLPTTTHTQDESDPDEELPLTKLHALHKERQTLHDKVDPVETPATAEEAVAATAEEAVLASTAKPPSQLGRIEGVLSLPIVYIQGPPHLFTWNLLLPTGGLGSGCGILGLEATANRPDFLDGTPILGAKRSRRNQAGGGPGNGACRKSTRVSDKKKQVRG